MAWKVYGFMEGRDADGRKRPALYGPLARKRWVRDIPHKRHKVKHRATATSRGTYDRTAQAHDGIEYARWLASRDGIALPDGSETAIWANVVLPTGKTQMRVSCVMFFGKPNQVRIDIPNWDWIPVEPVLQINDDYFRDLLAA